MILTITLLLKVDARCSDDGLVIGVTLTYHWINGMQQRNQHVQRLSIECHNWPFGEIPDGGVNLLDQLTSLGGARDDAFNQMVYHIEGVIDEVANVTSADFAAVFCLISRSKSALIGGLILRTVECLARSGAYHTVNDFVVCEKLRVDTRAAVQEITGENQAAELAKVMFDGSLVRVGAPNDVRLMDVGSLPEFYVLKDTVAGFLDEVVDLTGEG